MSEVKIYCSDLESTGLLHHLIEQGDKAKMHNFCAKSIETGSMWTFHTDTEQERSKISKFLDREIVLIMHNGICYDRNALKFFGYDVSKVHFVDTLALSWYLDLNRPRHGLESYGDEFGVPKPEIKDWEDLTQEDYDERVQEDVKIQYLTYKKLKSRFEEIYGKMSDYQFCTHKVVKYLNFKMEQLSEQEQTKFKVDVPKAKSLVEQFTKEIEFKVEQLKSVMPQVPVYQKHKRPAKPFKQNGELSVTGIKWKALTDEHKKPFDYDGEIKTVKSYAEPNPNSSAQIKSWLDSLGWIPETFKYVKDDNGSERKIPQIYVQGSGGQVCPSIEKLSKKNPALDHLVGLGVLSHRKGCVQAFIDNAIFGEYVEAGASGFTNTLRLKHRKPCVNLPSTRVIYGEEVRSCLIARDGKMLGGADLSSLENRIKFNLQLPYDREYVLSQMSDDFDPHLEIAQEGGLLKDYEVWFYKIEKEGFERSRYPDNEKLDELLAKPESDKKSLIKHISEVRGKGKGTNYSCQYGAGAATVARTAGVSLTIGKALVKAYKKVNWSIEKIAASQKVKKTSFGDYQLNPFNGVWYSLKTEKDRFSTLVQGTGAYVLDIWLKYQFIIRDNPEYGFDENGVRLLATFHDEQIIEFKEDFKESAERLIRDALDKVNKNFKLEIPFGCDVQFGKRYSDIH